MPLRLPLSFATFLLFYVLIRLSTAIDSNKITTSTETDEEGNYTLSGLPNKEVQVNVSFRGIEDTKIVSLTAGQEKQQDFSLPLPRLVGQVTSEDKDEAIQKAKVQLLYKDKTQNADPTDEKGN